jgi:hypothetical protein
MIKMNESDDKVPVSALFHEHLVSCNNLGNKGFHEWVFHPAMLFGSVEKWWSGLGKRNISHEGLDLCYYRTEREDIQSLNSKTKVPVIFNGQVIKVCDDFLGKSIFVRHNFNNANKCRLYTIYGHIKPGTHVQEGERLTEGDIIGTLFNKRNNNRIVPYHLHISTAWISDLLNLENLGWQILQDANMVKLLDPLKIIRCPYQISADI